MSSLFLLALVQPAETIIETPIGLMCPPVGQFQPIQQWHQPVGPFQPIRRWDSGTVSSVGRDTVTDTSPSLLSDEKIRVLKKKSCSQKSFVTRLNHEIFDEQTRKRSNVGG